MEGLMMDYPLTLKHAYDRAVRLFGKKEIVTQKTFNAPYIKIPITLISCKTGSE